MVGALRDVPCIVLDPEVSAKLHGLVRGAELVGGGDRPRSRYRRGGVCRKEVNSPAEEAGPPLRPQ